MSTPSTSIISNLKSAAAPTSNTLKAAGTEGLDVDRGENMSTPSTTIITNLKSVTAPTANTIADSVSYGIDVNGMLAEALEKAYELKTCLTLLAAHTDSADPNLTTLNNVLASLT